MQRQNNSRPDRTLPKRERLCRRKDMERLFGQGEAFLVYPVKCTYRVRPLDESGSEDVERVRVAVTASKRNHKRAVVRNLLKRRMRESYRLHKEIVLGSFEEGNKTGMDIVLSYIAKGEPLDFQTIETAVKRILSRLCRTDLKPSAEK